jgi:hypothetical protein
MNSKYSPAALSKIWALPAHLEHEPLIDKMFILQLLAGQLFLCVILFDKILHDGARFPKCQIGIGVDDC